MIGFLQSLLAFILALGILITFHEFGHFCVARICDVKILRFAIGFGRPLFRRYFGPDNTEFLIGALPLGGYVKMLDEREGMVATEEAPRAFNNKPLGQRFAIVVAGPLFNFLFAVAAYWLMFIIGVNGIKPIIGAINPDSLAERAGFQAGDEILAIDERDTPTWSSVIDLFVARVVEQEEVRFQIRDRDGWEETRTLNLSGITVDDMASGSLLATVGMQPQRLSMPAVLGRILSGGAAEAAGMQSGDRILTVDGEPVADWLEWVDLVRDNPGKVLKLRIQRNDQDLSIAIIPSTVTEDGRSFGRIGAMVDESFRNDPVLAAVERYTVLEALPRALVRTWEMSVMTLRILGKMIIGEASVKNLSGPISIAQYAGYSAGLGLAVFLGFLAIVSVSLGVLNLLPVPLLDGGHLLYFLVEWIKGSPVPESVQAAGQQVGLAVLLGLMGLAFYNDILRLVG